MIMRHGPDAREDALTDQQVAFLKMVERNIRQAKADRLNGELTFKAQMRDGGIMDSYKKVKSREK